MPSSVAMTSPPGKSRAGFLGSIFGTLELIKFSHSVFALPFAFSAMLVAAHGVPDIMTLVWILWCLVAARTAAMAFNRWADGITTSSIPAPSAGPSSARAAPP